MIALLIILIFIALFAGIVVAPFLMIKPHRRYTDGLRMIEESELRDMTKIEVRRNWEGKQPFASPEALAQLERDIATLEILEGK